jgi:hypothetical protein
VARFTSPFTRSGVVRAKRGEGGRERASATIISIRVQGPEAQENRCDLTVVKATRSPRPARALRLAPLATCVFRSWRQARVHDSDDVVGALPAHRSFEVAHNTECSSSSEQHSTETAFENFTRECVLDTLTACNYQQSATDFDKETHHQPTRQEHSGERCKSVCHWCVARCEADW